MAVQPDADLSAFPAVCAVLIGRPPVSTPSVCQVVDSALIVEFGDWRLVMGDVVGDTEWLLAAHRLGGLLVRITPHASPSRVALFAQWEGQMITITGTPR